jgi:hypothetical protein
VPNPGMDAEAEALASPEELNQPQGAEKKNIFSL